MAVPVTTPATTFLAVRIATTTALTAVIVSRYVRMGKPLRLARFTEERSVLPVARRAGVEIDRRPTTSSAYIATTYRRRQGPCCVGTIPEQIDGWPYYRHPRGQNVRATAEKSEKILRYPAAAGGITPVLPRSFASSTAATLAVWRKTADRQTLPTTRIRNSAPRCGSRCPPPSGPPDRNLSATAPGRSPCPASCRESAGSTRAECRRETTGCQ